ncbi:uncharacterized protein LOC134651663 [Cydia amplana]|uniref:uncharacterized protein LOC134651663 n=1 Tax=Cydia amplana TaxID=1869771 RepID=UPI002FE64918
MGMSRCYSLMKCLLILFNIVFLVIGLAACGLSVWALWEGGASAGVGGTGAGDAAAARAGLCAVAAWGGALALGAIAALWGAARDAPSLLAASFALLALCGVAEAAAACWGAAHLPQLRRALAQRLHHAVRSEYGRGAATQLLDTIQAELKCCGAESVRDWQSSMWSRAEAGASDAAPPQLDDVALDLSVTAPNSYYYVPPSCCLVSYILCIFITKQSSVRSRAEAGASDGAPPQRDDVALDLSVTAPNSYYYVPPSCCLSSVRSRAEAGASDGAPPQRDDVALDLSVTAPNSYYYVPPSCCLSSVRSRAEAGASDGAPPQRDDVALDLSVTAPNSYYYVPPSCCLSTEEGGDAASCAEARRVPAASSGAAGLHQAACATRVIHALEARQGKEVDRRTENAWKSYWSMKHLMKGDLPLSLKRRLMDMCILPVLTYGAQTCNNVLCFQSGARLPLAVGAALLALHALALLLALALCLRARPAPRYKA